MKNPIRLFTATLFVCINLCSLQSFAQADAGVSSVLTPITGSTLVLNSSYTVSVRVQNYGTTTLTSIPLKFNVGNSTPLEETWTGSLAAGDSVDYTFTSQFALTDTSISSAYCLTDINPDANVFNNSAYPVYSFAGPGVPVGLPDALTDMVIEQFILIPGQEIQIKIEHVQGLNTNISLIGLDGKIHGSQTVGASGTIDAVLDISALQGGLYLIVVESGSMRITQKVLFQ